MSDATRGWAWEGGPCLACLGVKGALQVGEASGRRLASPPTTTPLAPAADPGPYRKGAWRARAGTVAPRAMGGPGALRCPCTGRQGGGRPRVRRGSSGPPRACARGEIGSRACPPAWARAGGRGAPGRWNRVVWGGVYPTHPPSPLTHPHPHRHGASSGPTGAHLDPDALRGIAWVWGITCVSWGPTGPTLDESSQICGDFIHYGRAWSHTHGRMTGQRTGRARHLADIPAW